MTFVLDISTLIIQDVFFIILSGVQAQQTRKTLKILSRTFTLIIYNSFAKDTADMDPLLRKGQQQQAQQPQAQPTAKQVLFDFFHENYKEAKDFEKYFQDKEFKFAFDLLLKLGYGLFAVGVFLTVETNAVDEQAFIEYMQSRRNQIFLLVLVIFGVLDLSLLRIIKEENEFSAQSKKKMNVFVDGVRTIIYVIFIVFVYPFVFDNNNWSLTVSFGSIILAALLFVVRKILKWRFFMFDENGKTILQPWQSQKLGHKRNLSKFAEFLDYVIEKKVGPDGIKIYKNMQKLKQLQRRLVGNFQESKSLLESMTQSSV